MPITGVQLTWLAFILMFLGVAAMPVFLIMHLLMPKAAIKEYFKPPHFSYRECAVFSAYPLFFMRTMMFMAVFAFPHKGRKRQMTEAYLLAPKWYRIASKWMIIFVLGDGVAFASILLIVYFFY